MEINIKYTLDVMKKYLAIPSPSGYTLEAILEAKKDFEGLGLETEMTNKGALIATLRGENDAEHVLISAHMDTLGAMVKDITAEGRLKYHRIGGGCYSAVEGENCFIITRTGKKIRGSIVPHYGSAHVYGQERANQERNENNLLVRIDEKVKSKDDVLKLGIRVGDFICMDTRTEITESGFIKTRYIDDKAAVAMVFEIVRFFKENKLTPKYTTHFFISNYEESGHGVAGIPEKTKEMIAIDIGTVGEGQQTTEYTVSIAAKDRKSPYNFEFRNKLVNIAEENNIDYVVDVYNRYSSDSTQCIIQGVDINFACLGPGVDTSHHYERTHISSIENNIKLLIHYLLSK